MTSITTRSFEAQVEAIVQNLLRSRINTLPVLLLLGFECKNVEKEYDVTEAIAALLKRHLSNCSWYVQHFNAHADVGALRDGYLAGLNWLLRCILAQKSLE